MILSQYGSIFSYITPQRLAVLIRQPTPLFLPSALARPADWRSPHRLPIQMGWPPTPVPHRQRLLPRQAGHRPKQEATLTLLQIQSATAALGYLRTFPTFPTRITKIGKARPLEADFQRIPFATFISCDNYYQGFLQTKDEERLKELTQLLYPGIKPRCLTRPILYSAFYWFASLKQYFARLFPHFLQPMSADEQNLLGYAPPIGEMLRQSMNAQIRALTGGDITKEDAVLNMDTWRALTELDAKVKEVKDIKRQTKW